MYLKIESKSSDHVYNIQRAYLVINDMPKSAVNVALKWFFVRAEVIISGVNYQHGHKNNQKARTHKYDSPPIINSHCANRNQCFDFITGFN